MDVFELFTPTSYTFLQLESKIGGNTVIAEFPTNGIVKLREGMAQADNLEVFESSPTVHIRPTEAFVDAVGGQLTGHGVRTKNFAGNDVTYRIVDWKPGFDYDLGVLSFYLVALKRESLWDGSSLPLE